MKNLAEPSVGIHLDNIVEELYPDLTKEELDEVVYEVYHHMNLNSLRKQAEEKIHKYVHVLFPQSKRSF
tara:strand:- start:1264 stop:1470 length:207 start_codon:yes stop_codon:yes gene_type:complete